VNSMLLWAFAENRAARGFYESLGGVPVAETASSLAARGCPRWRTAGRTWTCC